MPVTELAHVILLPTKSISKDLKPIIKQIMVLQDKWCNAHAAQATIATTSSPIAAEQRGAAIFQQAEDPRKILITAHWDSVDEHLSWVPSAENKEACEYLFPLVDVNDVDFFHVHDTALFPTSVLRGSKDAVDIVLTRFWVKETDKQSFEDKTRRSQNAIETRGGWRIEKDTSDDADVAQYIVVGEQHIPDFNELEKLSVGHETRHYRKVCYE